jgi:membrane-associated protease RseP (regulator of RpoE activity)
MPEGMAFQIEGNSILYLLSKYVIFGSFLPSPASFGETTPFLYWIKYFFTGQPIPLGGMDVMLHQVAWAGWAGILVTALNLIPVGQLDGGHILNSLLGKNARKVVPVIIGLLVLLGFVWSGWWLWAAIIFFMSRIPASPLDTITKIDKKRKRLGLVMMIIFILVFTPVPIMVIF